MSSIQIREPRADEAAALADMLNAYSTEVWGEADVSVDEMRHWFGLPHIWIRVAESGERLVAYLDVTDEDDEGRRFHIDARPVSMPAARAVVSAGEEFARGRAVPGAIVRGYSAQPDRRLRAAYEEAGFRVIRHSFQMRIELGAVPAPEWPSDVSVRTYRPDDDDLVWELMNETFADHWDHQPPTEEGRKEWRHHTLENPRFDPELWFLAEEDGDLAGISLCQWHQSGDPAYGFVQVLGVRRPWRRRGLALALLQHSFGEFARRGATRVGLGVDAENLTGAVRLYERAGMHAHRTSDIWEKQL